MLITPITLNQDPSHQLRQIHQVTLSQPQTLKLIKAIIQSKQNKFPNHPSLFSILDCSVFISSPRPGPTESIHLQRKKQVTRGHTVVAKQLGRAAGASNSQPTPASPHPPPPPPLTPPTNRSKCDFLQLSLARKSGTPL